MGSCDGKDMLESREASRFYGHTDIQGGGVQGREEEGSHKVVRRKEAQGM